MSIIGYTWVIVRALGGSSNHVMQLLAPTQGRRGATDEDGNPVDGVLANYFVAPSAAGPPTPEREGADPDPGRAERIVHALDTCLETISESVTDVDLDERETTTEVPPTEICHHDRGGPERYDTTTEVSPTEILNYRSRLLRQPRTWLPPGARAICSLQSLAGYCT